MQFRNVVLCDNRDCGAILRLGGGTSISVELEHDATGHFFYCPRCAARTGVTIDGMEHLAPARGTDSAKRLPG